MTINNNYLLNTNHLTNNSNFSMPPTNGQEFKYNNNILGTNTDQYSPETTMDDDNGDFPKKLRIAFEPLNKPNKAKYTSDEFRELILKNEDGSLKYKLVSKNKNDDQEGTFTLASQVGNTKVGIHDLPEGIKVPVDKDGMPLGAYTNEEGEFVSVIAYDTEKQKLIHFDFPDGECENFNDSTLLWQGSTGKGNSNIANLDEGRASAPKIMLRVKKKGIEYNEKKGKLKTIKKKHNDNKWSVDINVGAGRNLGYGKAVQTFDNATLDNPSINIKGHPIDLSQLDIESLNPVGNNKKNNRNGKSPAGPFTYTALHNNQGVAPILSNEKYVFLAQTDCSGEMDVRELVAVKVEDLLAEAKDKGQISEENYNNLIEDFQKPKSEVPYAVENSGFPTKAEIELDQDRAVGMAYVEEKYQSKDFSKLTLTSTGKDDYTEEGKYQYKLHGNGLFKKDKIGEFKLTNETSDNLGNEYSLPDHLKIPVDAETNIPLGRYKDDEGELKSIVVYNEKKGILEHYDIQATDRYSLEKERFETRPQKGIITVTDPSNNLDIKMRYKEDETGWEIKVPGGSWEKAKFPARISDREFTSLNEEMMKNTEIITEVTKDNTPDKTVNIDLSNTNYVPISPSHPNYSHNGKIVASDGKILVLNSQTKQPEFIDIKPYTFKTKNLADNNGLGPFITKHLESFDIVKVNGTEFKYKEGDLNSLAQEQLKEEFELDPSDKNHILLINCKTGNPIELRGDDPDKNRYFLGKNSETGEIEAIRFEKDLTQERKDDDKNRFQTMIDESFEYETASDEGAFSDIVFTIEKTKFDLGLSEELTDEELLEYQEIINKALLALEWDDTSDCDQITVAQEDGRLVINFVAIKDGNETAKYSIRQIPTTGEYEISGPDKNGEMKTWTPEEFQVGIISDLCKEEEPIVIVDNNGNPGGNNGNPIGSKEEDPKNDNTNPNGSKGDPSINNGDITIDEIDGCECKDREIHKPNAEGYYDNGQPIRDLEITDTYNGSNACGGDTYWTTAIGRNNDKRVGLVLNDMSQAGMNIRDNTVDKYYVQTGDTLNYIAQAAGYQNDFQTQGGLAHEQLIERMLEYGEWLIQNGSEEEKQCGIDMVQLAKGFEKDPNCIKRGQCILIPPNPKVINTVG